MMSDTMFVCLLLQTNIRSIPISYFQPLYFLRYYYSIITIIVNVITINVVLTVIIFKSVLLGLLSLVLVVGLPSSLLIF